MFRRPRQTDEAHLKYIRQLPCCICLDNISTEAAHLRQSDARIGKINPGIGQKPSDCYTIPLCSTCHRRQHEIGEKAYFKYIDPILLALALYSVSGDVEQGKHIIRCHIGAMAE